MNKNDLIIMSYLRNNCRETLTDMSRKSRIPISTIYEKIKRNENGVIKRHTCLVDFGKLGFSTKAKIMLQSVVSHRSDLQNFLLKHQNVNSMYKINNGYDYLIETIFRNMRELEEFMELLQTRFKIKKYETYFVIDDIKREAFMTDLSVLELAI